MKRFGKWKQRMQEKKGFTLIEMIIVIAIIAILITLIAPSLMKFLQTAKQTKVDGAAKTLYTSANALLTERYVAGTPITTGWTQASAPTVPGKNGAAGDSFNNVYFNSEEISGCEYTVVLKDGVVDYVTWKDKGGLESRYPKSAASGGTGGTEGGTGGTEGGTGGATS